MSFTIPLSVLWRRRVLGQQENTPSYNSFCYQLFLCVCMCVYIYIHTHTYIYKQ